MKLWLLLLILFSLEGKAQKQDRTIEVTGYASKKFLADKFYVVVGLYSDASLEIPNGVPYYKYVRGTSWSNKKMYASTIDIFDGIIAYLSGRVSVMSYKDYYKETGDFGFVTKDRVGQYLTFDNNVAVQEFLSLVKDYKGDIDTRILAICSGVTQRDYNQIREEAIHEAGTIAEQMTQKLKTELGPVMNIYDERPDAVEMIEREKGKLFINLFFPRFFSDWYLRSHKNPNVSEPDSHGNITITRSVYIRFNLK